jgi:hypothetical protein
MSLQQFVSPAHAHTRCDQVSLIAWATLLTLVLGFVCLIRIRLLNMPLERDEDEYAMAVTHFS